MPAQKPTQQRRRAPGNVYGDRNRFPQVFGTLPDRPAIVNSATPTIVLGTTAAEGVAVTSIRSDATIVAFDAAVPATQAMGDAAATGAAAVASRRDHKHAMPIFAAPTVALSTAAAAGSAATALRSDATIAAFDATVPNSVVPGDASAAGTAAFAARRDHQHGMNAAIVFHKVIRKTATETVNNSAALQNDDDFSFTINASEVWQFELTLSADIKALSQFRCTWTLPAGASMLMMLIALGDNLTSANAVTATQTTPGTAITTGAAIALGHVYIRGTLVNAGTPGTAQFQWAQQTAIAEDTKLLINSYLVAHKIG